MTCSPLRLGTNSTPHFKAAITVVLYTCLPFKYNNMPPPLHVLTLFFRPCHHVGPLVNGVPVANMLISVFNNAVNINIEFTNAVSSLVHCILTSH